MGDPLGHSYELLEPIGYGAFSRVWRAHTRNGETVAAKLLRPEYSTDDSVRGVSFVNTWSSSGSGIRTSWAYAI